MHNVLFFFPHNPYPPRFGAHKRCLQLLGGLGELGYRVTFASSAYRNRGWSETAVKDFSNHFNCGVEIFRPTVMQRGASAGYDYLRKLAFHADDISQRLTVSYGREWFSEIVKRCKPDQLFMNYANYDALVDWHLFAARNSIIEIHDLITVNKQMRLALKRAVGNRALITGNGIEAALDLDFFTKCRIEPDHAEYEIYDRYRYTLCISEQERISIAANTSRTMAMYLPMTCDAVQVPNTHSDEALLCLGPNPFNTQGYYFFIRKVLPIIRKDNPEFRLKVTGYFYGHCPPPAEDNIVYAGFVDDLKATYETARFFVCPVFGGTGQQIKIVEAMAHGLAVVAFPSAASRSPLQHGINGLIADSAEEFADHVMRLWKNKSLCRKMGNAARETVEMEFSQNRLLEGLAPLMEAKKV